MKIQLGNALYDKCHELQTNGVVFIKNYEIAFQEVIEKIFPDKCWWEVTDCEIFLTLLETRSPEKTIAKILEKFKEEQV